YLAAHRAGRLAAGAANRSPRAHHRRQLARLWLGRISRHILWPESALAAPLRRAAALLRRTVHARPGDSSRRAQRPRGAGGESLAIARPIASRTDTTQLSAIRSRLERRIRHR